MAPTPPPPVPLFLPAPATTLVGNTKLENALKAAVTAITAPGKPPKFGLTVVDLVASSGSASGFVHAGFNQDSEHYAASMLKAACLYAAHALRDLAQRFAKTRKPKDPDTFFKMVNAELDPAISVCCPMITGRAPKVRLPRWRDVFTAVGSGAGMSVRFSPGYTTSLERMIVPSDNGHAGRCIRGVGYAYLNGVLREHKFFDDSGTPKRGVWLAGDYSGSDVVTIPCDNDGDTKQGSTTATMARLGVTILLGSVLPAASHSEMTDLLKKSANGPDSSYWSRTQVQNHLNASQVTHGKIGYGPLKSNTIVFSDVNAINDPLGTGGRFLVCYSNVDYKPYAVDHVLWVFLETVRLYQSTAPAATSTAPSTSTSTTTLTPTATH